MTVRTLARPLTTRLVAADNLHMRVRPSLRISTTQRSADGLEITIPARRNFVLVAFLGAWLVGWSVGEFFAFRELIAGKTDAPAIFLAGWLVMWTIGGATAAYVWLWMLTGKEVVRLRYPALVIKRDLLGFGPAKEFDLSHTRNLRVATAFRNPFDWSAGLQFWGIGGGLIAFDYGAKTVRFGASLEEPEAHEVVKELKAAHRFQERPHE